MLFITEDLFRLISFVKTNFLFLDSFIYEIANPFYNDTRYNSNIRYSVNLICTKTNGSCIFSLTVLCYSLGKHTIWILVTTASLRRF